MSKNTPDTQKKLRQLQQQYVTKLPQKITELEQDWQEVNQHPSDTVLYQNLIRGFHTLAGSAGSYGFPAITTLCREIEDALNSGQLPLTTAFKLDIDKKLATLKLVAKTGPAN